MSRDVEADPRAGDLVRVIPALTDEAEPEPVVIVEVTPEHVYWTRAGSTHVTARTYWSGLRVNPGPRTRLVLLAEAPE